MSKFKVLTCAAVLLGAQAFQIDHPWFHQWDQTSGYIASDGSFNRIPLRLASHNAVIYGGADFDAVNVDFAHEDFVPVKVGGKVPVQLWMNNFTDTDCGPEDAVNPYLETWYSFPVTNKTAPLELPFESPFSYNVVDPKALIWCHRVLCAEKKGHKGPALAAIAGGREIWGFPKHPAPANIEYDYNAKGDRITFSATHQGNKVYSASLKLPESNNKTVVTVPVAAETAGDACLTPKQSPTVPGFIPKQTRYGQAFRATMNFAPWDPAEDTLAVVGEDSHFGARLKRWNFKPALKMHSTDFMIVAFKPHGWSAYPEDAGSCKAPDEGHMEHQAPPMYDEGHMHIMADPHSEEEHGGDPAHPHVHPHSDEHPHPEEEHGGDPAHPDDHPHAAMHTDDHAHPDDHPHAAMHTDDHAHPDDHPHAAMHTDDHAHPDDHPHAAMHTDDHAHPDDHPHAANNTDDPAHPDDHPHAQEDEGDLPPPLHRHPDGLVEDHHPPEEAPTEDHSTGKVEYYGVSV